ncbi:bifunctional 5,10-methylenetetrahydrofolate dehydrogenase/5,10-methenyltetrahydrofolate cyclohydrolase [Candidatus Gracilibacteria bacterium]|nr:bifunctional 5,10-methylenetetrahydrofolate dehydrogenase/5,10-methenyltetrahydrofolate cyclohydrolase [Candidatus Gracilibacteria bacterium]
MQLLSGKDLSINLQSNLQSQYQKVFADKPVYVAIIFLGDDYSSTVYVNHKKKYGEKIGISTIVFGQSDFDNGDFSKFRNLDLFINQEYTEVHQVIELIQYLNYDPNCVGIIVQLPLPANFQSSKALLLSTISPAKDIDGIGGINVGLSSIDLIDFLPATPKAVLYLLDQYKLGDLNGKVISILGQSNLIGKPLALECIKRGATVFSFNENSDISHIKEITLKSDYIISCTGKVHLIDLSFIREDNSQVIVDVGYGHIDGKPVGDVNFDNIKDKVGYITPVPGGVGPLTVACLFDNIFTLQEHKEILKKYKL